MYTRRRTVQATHNEDEPCQCQNWSIVGLLGAVLVQVASYSTFASFGVMLSYLLGDAGPSWELLTVPIAFVVTWNITEPIMQSLASHTDRRKLWIAVVAGSALGGQGAFWAAKSPILFDYLIPLIGVVCGCGAGICKWASSQLVKNYLPPHPWSLRLFDQVTASLAFLSIPVFSYFIMDYFGDHGGLLMHCGILMQGILGGVLLRSTKWKMSFYDIKQDRRTFPLVRNDLPTIIISSDGDDVRKVKRKDSPIQNQPRIFPQWSKRNSFNLQPKTSSTRASLHSLRRPSLPCILEEEDEIYANLSGESSGSRITPPPRHSQTLPGRNAFNLKNVPSSRTRSHSVNRSSSYSCKVNVQEFPTNKRKLSSRRTIDDPLGLTESIFDEEILYRQKDEIIIFEPAAAVPLTRTVEKCPRTFQHVFAPGRLVAKRKDSKSEEKQEQSVEIVCKEVIISSTEKEDDGERSDSERCFCFNIFRRYCPHRSDKTRDETCCCFCRNMKLNLGDVGKFKIFSINWMDWLNPLVWLCSLLIFSCQNALLTYSALTPVLIKEYIFDADGGGMDGAYCVSVMGFTWLCFVLASPCFATIQKSTHQTICIVALSTSSITLYMVSQVNTLDEVVLYSSLFGLSYGVVTLTTHSLLRANLPAPMAYFPSPKLCIMVSLLHFVVLLFSAVGQWGDHLKALYILPTCCLAFTAALWAIHSCVSHFRESRSRREFTWSRPRRFS